MKIEKRSSGYRIQKMINGKRHSITFDHKPTKREIDEWVASKIVAPVTAQNAPNKTFFECANKYLDIKENVISASTYRSYRCTLNAMNDDFKQMLLSDIDQIAVQKYVNDLSAIRAPKTVRNHHAFISAVLQTFMPDFVLHTTLPQKDSKEMYIPTAEDIRILLDACHDSPYWICFKLGTYGLRRSELCALKYPEDFDGTTIHITKALVYGDDKKWHTKSTKTTGSERDIVISDELLQRIQDQGYVYNHYPDRILDNLHRYQDRLGLPRFRFHDLRHFFATEMSRVLPEQDWLKLGGWASPHVAKKVYRHSRIEKDKEMMKNASDQLENVLK